MSEDSGARLIATSAAGQGAEYPLGRYLLSIGRSRENDVVVESPLVSRLHARVEPQEGGYAIVDAGASNGLFVNGRRVQGRQMLVSGDRIQLGEETLIYVAPDSMPPAPVHGGGGGALAAGAAPLGPAAQAPYPPGAFAPGDVSPADARGGLVAPALSTYPVQLEIDRPTSSSRLWAFPIFGIFVKSIILLPQLIISAALAFAVSLLQLVLWGFVLFGGQYPRWGYGIVGGYLLWNVRFGAFYYGLTDVYPPFSLGGAAPQPAHGELVAPQVWPAGEQPYPVRVWLEIPAANSRFWATPIIGIVARLVFLVPHLIILYLLSVVVSVLFYIMWIPVLITGRYPVWGFDIMSGYLRWALRVQAYLFGLTDRYPPFRTEA